MTAQHSDLVSMWPRKIKHESLRTAMGTKTWFSAFSQASAHRRAANLPIPLQQRAIGALTTARNAETYRRDPKTATHPNHSPSPLTGQVELQMERQAGSPAGRVVFCV